MAGKSYNRPIPHQDYIKLKYLSESDSIDLQTRKKKKLLKAATRHKKIRIFDDDVDLKKIGRGEEDDEEFHYATKEEKPIVADVIDERPAHLRRNDIDTNRWKTIGSIDDDIKRSDDEDKLSEGTVKKRDESAKSKSKSNDKFSPGKSNDKRMRHDSDSDLSVHRNDTKRHDSDSDLSPSLHKKQKKHESSRDRPSHVYKDRKRHDSDSDLSPIRPNNNKRHDSDSDLSPVRMNDSKRHDSDSDLSPPRNKSEEVSRSRNRSRDNGLSSRISRTDKMSKSSGNTKENKTRHDDSDSDLSPPRATHESKNSEKTLSGKKAGLSDAKDLREELLSLKKKENKLFASISDDVLGKGAKTVFRDSKTGKIRNLEEEAANKQKEDAAKAKIEAEKKEKYAKWSKGLVQMEQQKERLESALHEMSKPLARYEDDEDLDKILRERDREEDPMLDAIRKKKAKKEAKEGITSKPVKPTYNGPTPPPFNRFNIMPGYRWDGVDRSNGFEKRLFDRINDREATVEEAYKWSTSDM